MPNFEIIEIIAEKVPNVNAICLVLWRTNLENNRNISLDESLDEELKNETEKVGNVFTDDAGSNIRIIFGLSVNTDEYQVPEWRQGRESIDASDKIPMVITSLGDISTKNYYRINASHLTYIRKGITWSQIEDQAMEKEILLG
ncbi:hypothetical protein RIR_jg38646.t1 [Rhizophagus irregularis DAOM 181602=DAOM 197198]|nr:hypothetical protein RIR_jg38646.t1 [Rhizophagus irregularis DAOM 181602=DAOM 197198]CAG8506611.1 9512_t:CDS:2 [Rhizophagus irregularis]